MIGLPLTLSTGSGQADGLQRNPSTGSGRDTVRVERVTERTRTLDSGSKIQDSRTRVEVVRDTIYVERKDSVEVQELNVQHGTWNMKPETIGDPKPSTLNLTLKWILWIIIGLIALIITVKVCLLRR